MRREGRKDLGRTQRCGVLVVFWVGGVFLGGGGVFGGCGFLLVFFSRDSRPERRRKLLLLRKGQGKMIVVLAQYRQSKNCMRKGAGINPSTFTRKRILKTSEDKKNPPQLTESEGEGSSGGQLAT